MLSISRTNLMGSPLLRFSKSISASSSSSSTATSRYTGTYTNSASAVNINKFQRAGYNLLPFHSSSFRGCSTSNNNNNNDDGANSNLNQIGKTLENVVSSFEAVNDRLEVLERVVSNLVMNAEAQQQQQQQHQRLRQDGSMSVSPSANNIDASTGTATTSEQQQLQQQQQQEFDDRAVSDSILRSVVKIYTSLSSPSCGQPWQTRPMTSSSGSGFLCDVERRLIMTNAHCVAFASLIEIKRHGGTKKVPATCVFMSGDCDLALLRVDDDDFWNSCPASPLPFYSELKKNNSHNNNNNNNNNNDNDNNSSLLLKGLEAIESISMFDGFPRLQSGVNVLGFPVGGESVSITQGVVSRVEQTTFSMSGCRLAAVQVDSAINPGNSGGCATFYNPQTRRTEIVGVPFQSLMQAENVGYLVSNAVVSVFARSYLKYEQDQKLNKQQKKEVDSGDQQQQHHHHHQSSSSDDDDHHSRGLMESFATLGIYFQETAAPMLRDFYKLPKDRDLSGFVIEKCLGGYESAKKLRAGDVVTAIDGYDIERDLTIALPHRPETRIGFTHVLQMKTLGDKVNFTVWRDAQEVDVEVSVQDSAPLVRTHLLHPRYAGKPDCALYAGCCFTTLTVTYLENFGNNWLTVANRALVDLWLYGERSSERSEIVLLCCLLPCEANRGYDGASIVHRAVNTVNDELVRDFDHFKELIAKASCDSSNKTGFIKIGIFESTFPLTLVLPTADKARESDLRVCSIHSIPTKYALSLSSSIEGEGKN